MIFVAGSFLIVWGFFLAHVAPSVTAGDSGEFITAAATLSIPHPPSYPLYSLVGKAFAFLLPWGNSGYKANVFSAALCLLSLMLVYQISRRLGLSRGAGVFGAWLLGSTPAFFHNGLITEVFALNTALALAVWCIALRGGPSSLSSSGFLTGIAMGNHHTVALIFPGWLVAWWSSAGQRRSNRNWIAVLTALGLFAAGLSIYLTLAVRSRQGPPLNWGNPGTLPALYRTISRKDYGALTLSLGETPARTFSNTTRQCGRFLKSYSHELSVAGIGLVAFGFFVLGRERPSFALSLGLLWFFSGPFFALLGNLGFDAQSDGVLERFQILPVAFSVFAAARAWESFRNKIGRFAGMLFILPVILFLRSGNAFPLRHDYLVQDYSRATTRILPPGAAFFMDGGDDTFFSMAFQKYVQRQRTDLTLFDRGGLIFGNPYGPDFRRLNRDEKEQRRREVEMTWLFRGPLYYSTMNEKILPDAVMNQRAFLYEASPLGSPVVRSQGDLGWTFCALRGLYPPLSADYRTLALAPFFPFMRARSLWNAGRYDDALAYLRRSSRVRPDPVTGAIAAPLVPWVQSNLVVQCLDFAFDRMQAQDWSRAEELYLLALEVDPSRSDAMTNLGVLSEKSGNWANSRRWYEKTLQTDPRNINALYNLSVVEWREGHWERVVSILDRVIAIDPNHPGAQRYLPEARRRLQATRP